jgi:hypothetical protein
MDVMSVMDTSYLVRNCINHDVTAPVYSLKKPIVVSLIYCFCTTEEEQVRVPSTGICLRTICVVSLREQQQPTSALVSLVKHATGRKKLITYMDAQDRESMHPCALRSYHFIRP